MADNDLAQVLAAAADMTIDRPEQTTAVSSFDRLRAVDRSDLPAPRFVPMRDGLPLAVRQYPADAERILVLVHGSGGHGAHMHALARAVTAAGIASVCALDLRGNGLSGARRSDAVTYPEQYRDDILDVLEALRTEQHGRRIIVGGHSAGGGVVLRLFDGGARPPEGLLLLAPLIVAGPPTTRPGLGGWATIYKNRLKAVMALSRSGDDALNGITVMEFNQPPETRDGCETLAWSFETVRAFGPGNWRVELAAAGKAGPVALVVGDADECFIAEGYAAVLGDFASAATVDVIPDCGHWDLLAMPAALAAVLARVGAM